MLLLLNELIHYDNIFAQALQLALAVTLVPGWA